jgi:hypothetical protein
MAGHTPAGDPIGSILGIELGQVHTRDRVEHEPREMTLRQPIPHVGRHQERLITVTTNEVQSHPGMVLNPPDDTVITRHPLAKAQESSPPQEAMNAIVGAMKLRRS